MWFSARRFIHFMSRLISVACLFCPQGDSIKSRQIKEKIFYLYQIFFSFFEDIRSAENSLFVIMKLLQGKKMASETGSFVIRHSLPGSSGASLHLCIITSYNSFSVYLLSSTILLFMFFWKFYVESRDYIRFTR